MSQHPVLILGGGISGLSTAWFLKKAGIPVRVIEQDTKAGGKISSARNGETVLDYGPNTLRDRNGDIFRLAKELGIENRIVEAGEAFKTRFIVRDKKLCRVAPDPLSLISTNILSARAKLRLLGEVFASKGDYPGVDESIGNFLERRIGREATEYLADPVFSGIYAGNIYELSKRELLPEPAAFEEEYGSVIKGLLRSPERKSKKANKKHRKGSGVLSFRNGMQDLTDALQTQLSDELTEAEVRQIRRENDLYTIETDIGSFTSNRVVSTLPAHILSELIHPLQPELSEHLSRIEYSPVLSTQVIYRKADLNSVPDGFGFLVPRKENIRLLGAIWKTRIFPQLSDPDHMHFTLLSGGAHDRRIRYEPTGLTEKEIIQEFEEIMGIRATAVFTRSRLWDKAIPQFKVGYPDRKKEILGQSGMEGFTTGGNFIWGVSVPDCINGARNCAESLM